MATLFPLDSGGGRSNSGTPAELLEDLSRHHAFITEVSSHHRGAPTSAVIRKTRGSMVDTCIALIQMDVELCTSKLAALGNRSVLEFLWYQLYDSFSSLRRDARTGGIQDHTALTAWLQHCYARLCTAVSSLHSELDKLAFADFKAVGALLSTGVSMTPPRLTALTTDSHSPPVPVGTQSPVIGAGNMSQPADDATSTSRIARKQHIRHALSSVSANLGDISRYLHQAAPKLTLEGCPALLSYQHGSSAQQLTAFGAKAYAASMLFRPSSSHVHHKLALLAQQSSCQPLFLHYLLTAWSNCASPRDAVAMSLADDIRKIYADIDSSYDRFACNKIVRRLGAISCSHLVDDQWITTDYSALVAASIRLSKRSHITGGVARTNRIVTAGAARSVLPPNDRLQPVLLTAAVASEASAALLDYDFGASVKSLDPKGLIVQQTMPVRHACVTWVLTRCMRLAAMSNEANPVGFEKLTHAICFDLGRLIRAQSAISSTANVIPSEPVFRGKLLTAVGSEDEQRDYESEGRLHTIITPEWVCRIMLLLAHAISFSDKLSTADAAAVMPRMHAHAFILVSLLQCVAHELRSIVVSELHVNTAARVHNSTKRRRGGAAGESSEWTLQGRSRISAWLKAFVVALECILHHSYTVKSLQSCVFAAPVPLAQPPFLTRAATVCVDSLLALRNRLEPLCQQAGYISHLVARPILSECVEMAGSGVLRSPCSVATYTPWENRLLTGVDVNYGALITVLGDAQERACIGTFEGCADTSTLLTTSNGVLEAPASELPTPLQALPWRLERIMSVLHVLLGAATSRTARKNADVSPGDGAPIPPLVATHPTNETQCSADTVGP